MTDKKNQETPVDFEKSLKQLTTIVEKIEQGQLPLEQSLQQFEQGIALIRDCQSALTAAEQKVTLLTQQNTLEAFDQHD